MFLTRLCSPCLQSENIQGQMLVQLPQIRTIPIRQSVNIKLIRSPSLTQLQKNRPYTDKQFPPNQQSLNYKSSRNIIWKRISEIYPQAILVNKSFSDSNVLACNRNDSYFLPAISAIASYHQKIMNIFSEQCLNMGYYTIVCKVNGIMKEMAIDDFVPVYKETDRPVFSKPHKNCIWVMLIEKAWAKIKGSYQNILTGNTFDVLNTFCIGPCFTYSTGLNLSRDQIWSDLKDLHKNLYVVCGQTSLNPPIKTLRPKHTYTIESAQELSKKRLVTIKPNWQSLISQQQNNSSLSNANYNRQHNCSSQSLQISYESFLQNFSHVYISHNQPNFNFDFITVKSHDKKPNFIKLAVKKSGNNQAYISITPNFSSKDIAPSLLQSAYLLIVIGFEKEQGHYEYYSAKRQNNLMNNTIHCPNMQPGNYCILIKAVFHPQHYISSPGLNLSYYYNNQDNISQTSQQMKNLSEMVQQVNEQTFMQELLLSVSEREQRQSINTSNADNYYKCKMMMRQCGYVFFVFHLAPKSKQSLKVVINHDKLIGFTLKYRDVKEMRLQRGEEKILIFQYANNVRQEQQTIQFPTQALKITTLL